MRHFSLPLLLAAIFACVFLPHRACGQATEQWRAWNQPVEPFRIVGDLYYVGASDIASYLITTPQGHILLEGGFAETAPLIRANVAKLGFRVEDIKILLSSHAHTDHAGGLAELKRATGARLYAGRADAPLYAGGGKGDFHWGDRLTFPAVVVDELVVDGAKVELGGVTLVARATPGHSRGNLTWTMRVGGAEGRPLDVVFAGSVTAPGYTLTDNAAYPEIAADFARSFAMLKTLPCDVFLAPHGQVFGLTEKRHRLEVGEPGNPFIDPAGFLHWVARAEEAFAGQLRR